MLLNPLVFTGHSFIMAILIGLLFSFVIPLICIYLWYQHKFSYWKNKNIKGPKPTIFFGNTLDLFKYDKMGFAFKKLYEENKDEPFVGLYVFHRPALLLNDVDLVKSVMVKDFGHFVDHGFEFPENTQPLWRHLFMVNGAKWRNLRTKMSPAFTSSKIKNMFETIVTTGEELVDFLKEDAAIGSTVDFKTVFWKYNINVIVSCAFGIESNCLKNPDDEFYMLNKRIFGDNYRTSMHLLMALLVPNFLRITGFKSINETAANFFIKTIDDTIKYREKNNITRSDMMQSLIRIKNNQSLDETNDTVVADGVNKEQLSITEIAELAFGIYGASSDTSTTTLCYILYELAKHQDIQNKLRRDIEDVIKKYDNKITYDSIFDMTYMQQVIKETLRFHPPVVVHTRGCTKDYVIPNTDIEIEKDTLVLIPAFGFQSDPKLFPNPDVFDPERFSPENEQSRNYFSFLPFGEGPRVCIGQRFAIMQVSIALISVLRNYEINIDKNHVLEFDQHFLILPPKSMLLKISNRK